MAAAIRLRGAVSLLGRFPALAGVDLDVERGEILHLEGANGAGKTTLLRACAGLAPVTSGEAVVLGHDIVRDRRAVRRRVGLLGHDTFLYDDLSVHENVVFATRAARADTRRVETALERFGLGERLSAVPVARLSAGQRRRAALAVIAARAPDLWLLDEPHAGLDAGARDVIDEVVREAAAAGATVVLASHEHDRARVIAGRSVVLAGGVVRTGAPADVA